MFKRVILVYFAYIKRICDLREDHDKIKQEIAKV